MISIPIWLMVVLICLSVPTVLLALSLFIGVVWDLVDKLIHKHAKKKESKCPYKVEKENDR